MRWIEIVLQFWIWAGGRSILRTDVARTQSIETWSRSLWEMMGLRVGLVVVRNRAKSLFTVQTLQRACSLYKLYEPRSRQSIFQLTQPPRSVPRLGGMGHPCILFFIRQLLDQKNFFTFPILHLCKNSNAISWNELNLNKIKLQSVFSAFLSEVHQEYVWSSNWSDCITSWFQYSGPRTFSWEA